METILVIVAVVVAMAGYGLFLVVGYQLNREDGHSVPRSLLFAPLLLLALLFAPGLKEGD